MIKIENLNKFYESKRASMHHALKDVNLVLPDKGLVFVLGKSGSGKSTFLNMIGGLDSASSGRIVVDGNDISHMTESQFVHYRNSCIGFIFQDHHLIDDLTLAENIQLVLDLRHIRDEDLVSEALEQVGLAGYEDRYPRELSGGERQRVAIARAIVKQPRIILADEPTGNLDGRNAAEVMRILKALSKECLVLTVSHNTAEVHANADRIIELSEGQIISDVIRNPDYPDGAALCDGTLQYPDDRLMTPEDVTVINEGLAAQKIHRFALRRDKFKNTPSMEGEGRQLAFKKTHLGLFKVFALSAAFLKTKVNRIVSVAVPLAMILLIMLMSQTYIDFDANRIIGEQMEKADQQAIVLSKVISIDGVAKNARRFHDRVTPEELQAFRNTGFDGEIYPIVNLTVPITSYKNASGYKTSAFSYGVVATESLGTVCVDEEFFIERLGSLEYLARVREFDPKGVVITDYLADVILETNKNYSGCAYIDLLGSYSVDGSGIGDVYINGVIDTKYLERYDALIDRVQAEKETDIAELYNDEEFQKLSSELYSFLAYAYSFNPDLEAEIRADETRTWYWSHKLSFDGKAGYTIGEGYVWMDDTLQEGEITMSLQMYNSIFGKSYNADNLDTFQPHEAELSQYAYHDTEEADPLFTTKVRIVGLYGGSGMRISPSVSRLFAENHVRQTGVYFNGLSHLSDVLEVAEKHNYIQDSVTLEGILTLTRCVMLFVTIFQLVNIVLCGAVVFIFISFATKMIRDKLHEIGILKALGAGSGTLNVIFGLQIGLIALITCSVSVLSYLVLVDPANTLFILSLREMVPSQLVLDLDVLVFIPEVATQNVLLIVILAVISLAAPMAKIRKIRPVQIINTRD